MELHKHYAITAIIDIGLDVIIFNQTREPDYHDATHKPTHRLTLQLRMTTIVIRPMLSASAIRFEDRLERVGQGEVGGCTAVVSAGYRKAWSALGGPFFCFLAQTSGICNLYVHNCTL